MQDFASDLLTLPPPFNMVVMIVLLFAAASVLETLIKAARDYADGRAQERFKLELMQNGLSVEEARRWTQLSVEKRRSHARKKTRQPRREEATEYDAENVLA